MRLGLSFFEGKSTLELAQEFLGKVLVFESPLGVVKGIVCETEAYTQDDESCHAFGGRKTKRNEVMFSRAGHLYVYFTYGMYYCCNVVTGDEGRGEAVLIRSVDIIEGVDVVRKNRGGKVAEKDLTNGPAKVCMAYGFDKVHNGIDLLEESSRIYIEDLGYVFEKIERSPRIGISKDIHLEWRFFGIKRKLRG